MNVLSTLVIAGRTASAIADPTSVALTNASATVVEITDLLILILLAKKPLQNAFLKCCGVKEGIAKTAIMSCRYYGRIKPIARPHLTRRDLICGENVRGVGVSFAR